MKVSPYSLELPKRDLVERTFRHWKGKQYQCSCGLKFNGETPERDANFIQACPNSKEGEKHEVKQNDPQLSLSMKFRVMSQLEAIAIQGIINQAIVKYVTGVGEKGKPGYIAPILLAPVSGNVVVTSEPICQVACVLEKCQFVAEGEPSYSFEELVAFMASDLICDQMMRTMGDLVPGSEPDPLALTATE